MSMDDSDPPVSVIAGVIVAVIIATLVVIFIGIVYHKVKKTSSKSKDRLVYIFFEIFLGYANNNLCISSLLFAIPLLNLS